MSYTIIWHWKRDQPLLVLGELWKLKNFRMSAIWELTDHSHA